MCTIACDVFVQNHPKISCSREECFSLSVGLFHFALFLVTHPPSPFPPSAPVLFSIRLRITAAHEKSVSHFPSAYFTLLCLGCAPSFTVPAFGARVLSSFCLCVCRSGLWMTNVFVQDHPKISCSREECFSPSVGLFYFILSYAPSFTVPAFGARIILGLLVCVAAVYG